MPQKNRYIWIIFVSTFFQHCTSIDTIKQNQSFKDGDVLVSSGNSFAFGFFSPNNSTSNRYIGIWYHTISEQTVVWVANRDNPTNGTTGVLSLEKSGNLVLHDQSTNIALWSTNISGTLNGESYFVQLMETGNLMLCEGSNENVLWQSFQHPTDTLLPHMKQGINRTSGMVWSLTSWKSKDDPGTGDFQLKVNLSGTPQFFLYRNSEKIWRTGPFNGAELGGLPEMNGEFIFTSGYVENSDEVSLSFGISDPSVYSRVRVNESGTVDRLAWKQGQDRWNNLWSNPRDRCDHYSHCGSFSNCDISKLSQFECECLPGYEPKVESEWSLRDGRHGCVRKPGEPTCGSPGVDVEFIDLASVRVPDASNAVVNKMMGIKDCRDLCLRNCSCTAYASANVSNGGSGCITWYGDLIDMRKFQNNSQDVYLKVSAAVYAQYQKNLKRSSSKKLLIILVPLSVGVILLVFGMWLVLWMLKGKIQSLRKPLDINLYMLPAYGDTSRTEVLDEDLDHLPVYDLKAIISATNCFSLANKVGEGGFGSVYKGQLHNGREVAIKRLSKCSGQGMEEFRNEVTLIAKLQHRNLVKLLGCCIHQEEKMLVYEYLPNKGLDCFIFGKEHGALLDWRKRLNIILGIARGLVYLHRDSRLRIIHRDLKASNVLLDADMEPKISDFGMARIFNANQMEAITHRVVGTYGYMSPEYAMQGLFSEKSDVYSFGVLLLEIITGRRNTSYFGDSITNLTAYVWELWKDGAPLEIVDPAIMETFDRVEVGRCIQIGLLCVQDHARERPTMPEVLAMLCNQASVPSASPKQPVFVIRKADPNKSNHLPDSSSSYLRAAYVDNDEMTITVLQPR